MNGIFSFGVLVLCLTLSTQLLASESGSDEKSTPVNRLDFTYAAFDSDSLDKLTFFLGYTRSLSSKSNLNLRVAYLESRFGLSGGTGIGDTTVTWSYLPILSYLSVPGFLELWGPVFRLRCQPETKIKVEDLEVPLLLPLWVRSFPLLTLFRLLLPCYMRIRSTQFLQATTCGLAFSTWAYCWSEIAAGG